MLKSKRRKIIIYLANLSHMRDGRPSSEVIPLNIGLLASYLLRHLKNEVEVKIFNVPDKLEKAMESNPAHILTCSNYVWNLNLNYLYLSHYKKKYPGLVTVMGGPNYPGLPEAQESFLKKHKDLDFYIYMDGEKTLLSLVKKLNRCGLDVQKTKDKVLQGCHFISGGVFIDGGAGERLKDLNTIPSPYLAGIFDTMLKDGFIPILQTNKGCPFSCAYCCSGNRYYTKIYRFKQKRISAEIEYISKIAKAKTLQVADDNYGIFKGDIQTSRKLHECKGRTGWPIRINLSTSKVNKDRVFKTISLLGDAIFFSASMQSMNPDTLKEISRSNLSFEAYREIINKLLDNNVYTLCELIIGLPEETRDSYILAIKEALDANVRNIDSYTCMLLMNTPLFESGYYDKFKMKRRFRVLPRDYGEYLGQRVLETEEVCVSTRTLSVDDYIFLRGFSFIVAVFNNLRVFEELLSYLKSQGISTFDLLVKAHARISKDNGVAGKVYKDFVHDAKVELWNSESELFKYFQKQENFNKLLSGELGANLIQKYQAAMLDNLSYFADFLYKVIIDNYPQIKKVIIDDLLSFIVNARGDLFNNSGLSKHMNFRHDIPRWLKNGMKSDIGSFERGIALKFSLTRKQKSLLNNYLEIFGESQDARGKILTRVNPTILFKSSSYSVKGDLGK